MLLHCLVERNACTNAVFDRPIGSCLLDFVAAPEYAKADSVAFAP